MKRPIFLLPFIAGLIFLTGCKEDPVYTWDGIMTYYDMTFDQTEMEVTITPESEFFEVGFHRDAELTPPEHARPATEFWLSLTPETTATTRQFSIPGFNVPSNALRVSYNLTESTGSFRIHVVPAEITEPLTIVLRQPWYFERKVTIRLIPEA